MKQVHPELLDLIKTLEADETVKSVDFLTDGDPDEYPSTLKAILDHIETMASLVTTAQRCMRWGTLVSEAIASASTRTKEPSTPVLMISDPPQYLGAMWPQSNLLLLGAVHVHYYR